jgi:hypothetical protein
VKSKFSAHSQDGGKTIPKLEFKAVMVECGQTPTGEDLTEAGTKLNFLAKTSLTLDETLQGAQMVWNDTKV